MRQHRQDSHGNRHRAHAAVLAPLDSYSYFFLSHPSQGENLGLNVPGRKSKGRERAPLRTTALEVTGGSALTQAGWETLDPPRLQKPHPLAWMLSHSRPSALGAVRTPCGGGCTWRSPLRKLRPAQLSVGHAQSPTAHDTDLPGEQCPALSWALTGCNGKGHHFLNARCVLVLSLGV